jgi:hypothetical protein
VLDVLAELKQNDTEKFLQFRNSAGSEKAFIMIFLGKRQSPTSYLQFISVRDGGMRTLAEHVSSMKKDRTQSTT